MKKNEGKIDRILRVVLGVALIGSAFYTGITWLYIGVVPLITGAVGFCPAYKILGLSTCPLESRSSN